MNAFARLVGPVPGQDHPIKLQNLLLQAVQLSAERGKTLILGPLVVTAKYRLQTLIPIRQMARRHGCLGLCAWPPRQPQVKQRLDTIHQRKP
jgi:hypothetical protein